MNPSPLLAFGLKFRPLEPEMYPQNKFLAMPWVPWAIKIAAKCSTSKKRLKNTDIRSHSFHSSVKSNEWTHRRPCSDQLSTDTNENEASRFILVAIPTFWFPGNQSQTSEHSHELLLSITVGNNEYQNSMHKYIHKLHTGINSITLISHTAARTNSYRKLLFARYHEEKSHISIHRKDKFP